MSAEPQLWRLGSAELRERYLRRELSPVEVVDATLDHVAAVNPALNAIVTVTADLAREQARAAEATYASGAAGSADHALLGVPITVKDNIPTAGVRTTMGSLLFADFVPAADAVSVARVRRAGAILLGKTNTCEFGWKGDAGNRVFGPTRNPWGVQWTSGGSTGGGAAAVAAGLGPLAIGTDGAGSLRIPGSYCGVVGFKPSQGTVPIAPRGAIGTLAHHGPLARSVRDIAQVMAVLAGPDPLDRLSDPRGDRRFALPASADLTGLRVGWSPTLGFGAAEPETLALVTAGLESFRALGARVVEIDARLEDPHSLATLTFELAQAAQHARDLDAVRDRIDQGRLRVVEAGRGRTALDVADLAVRRDAFHRQVMALMEPIDVLVTPTLPTTASGFPPGADHPLQYRGAPTGDFWWTPFTHPFNLTGQPAISVPVGTDGDGLPVGLQIVGRWRDDEQVLRVAAAFEAARPWTPIAPIAG